MVSTTFCEKQLLNTEDTDVNACVQERGELSWLQDVEEQGPTTDVETDILPLYQKMLCRQPQSCDVTQHHSLPNGMFRNRSHCPVTSTTRCSYQRASI
ncbi:hypothetical protein IG631_24055 [Alternaria alternata]|nr:hypothetical protein IG631_24055 [Alternaria alternata]